MPLNPNGKVDKPALPFPDTFQSTKVQTSSKDKVTPTQTALRSIWSALLPQTSQPIPLNENFFDLGGHSILATRLIFEIRKAFVMQAPLGMVFEHPTIAAQSAAIDALRTSDFEPPWNANISSQSPQPGLLAPPNMRGNKQEALLDYAADFEKLKPQLLNYKPLPTDYTNKQLKVLLTGATGFLGAFVLRELLSQPRIASVVCLVRANSTEEGLKRLKQSSETRGVWDEYWVKNSRLSVVTGDLSQTKFGLSNTIWQELSEQVDAVAHNGALVSL